MAVSSTPEGRKNASPCEIIIPAAEGRQRTIVVLGCSRGGTSMVAGTLRILGVPMGRIVGPNHEDIDFITQDLDQIAATIAERNAQQHVWGWKYPHTIDYLGQILPLLRNPHFIVVFRNELSVGQSFHKYHPDIAILKGIAEAHARYGKIIQFISTCTHPLMLCSYEHILKQKKDFTDALSVFTGLSSESATYDQIERFMNEQRGYALIENV